MDEISSKKTASETSSSRHRSKNKKVYIIIGIIFLVFLLLYISLISSNTSRQNNLQTNQNTYNNLNTNTNTQTQTNNPQTQTMPELSSLPDLIYGTWSGENSIIKKTSLSTGKTSPIANLPSNIKKVSIISPTNLLYIDKTDNMDHGSQISVYNIDNKNSQVALAAENGFSIDDYALSPDKKYLADWEVAFAPNSNVLKGGKSRVYVVNLENPAEKHLIYDEVAETPIHYPKLVLENGTVLCDTFMPNDPNGGAGWAYGMSMSNFDGSQKQDLPQMQNGTYGTQPEPSADGKYLVFGGYDGKNGPGTEIISGFRQSILTPNTVEILDTSTMSRRKLPEFANTDTYPNVSVDKLTGNIIVTDISQNPADMGIYKYDVALNSKSRIVMPSNDVTNLSIVSLLPNDQLLLGNPQDVSLSIGNLGENYSPNLVQLFMATAKSTSAMSIPDPIIQYISTIPQNYINLVLGVSTDRLLAQNTRPTDTIYFDSNQHNAKGMQLNTFFVKLNLADARLNQQAGDDAAAVRCRDLAAVQCQAQNMQVGSDQFNECVKTMTKTLRQASKSQQTSAQTDQSSSSQTSSGSGSGSTSTSCYDSPLYLYGDEGQQVTVKVNTPVYNSVPEYNNGYDVTLGENGGMEISGDNYQSIKYDYLSAKSDLPALKTGKIAPVSQVAEVLNDYAQKLGLNTKETSDLVNFAKEKVTSPYVFISFYPQTLSEQILPLAFNPEPDNYLNVVFYFKLINTKPLFSAEPPSFPKIFSRDGLTAVEISEIVE